MQAYIWYLTALSVLFAASAFVLLCAALGQARHRRAGRAAAYLGLTLLSCLVAAGFYFFRRLL